MEKLKLVDNVNAEGEHNISVKISGLMVSGGSGNDKVTLFGGNMFAFGGGEDELINFHSNDAAPNHDVIQISKSFAEDFRDITVNQSGSDTVLTMNSHDTITLKGVDFHTISHSDFFFV